MAEGLLCATRATDPAEVVVETQGRPVSPDDEIRVVGDDGRPVPAGSRSAPTGCTRSASS